MSEQEINNGLRWYVIHTYSGYENKVKTDIEKMVDNRGLNDLVKLSRERNSLDMCC